MAPKIVIFAPSRIHNTLEKAAAKVTLVGDLQQLSDAIHKRVVDVVFLVDLPSDLRHQAMAEAQKAGHVATVCLGDGQVPAFAGANSGDQVMDPMERARRYMDENFRSPLTLDEIASHAGISAGYFCRRFKSRFQITPIMYLRNLRIAHATHLLLHTDLPLAAITSQSGFFSVSYFCREFHKVKGLAPITFRRQHSEKKVF